MGMKPKYSCLILIIILVLCNYNVFAQTQTQAQPQQPTVTNTPQNTNTIQSSKPNNVVSSAKQKVLSSNNNNKQAKLTVYKFGADGKPWSLSATGEGITISWIAFAIIVVGACTIGYTFGYKTETSRSDSATIKVNTDAYDVYV